MFEGIFHFRNPHADHLSAVSTDDIGKRFKEMYEPRMPAEPAFIAILGDLSQLEGDSNGVVLDLPIRGYLAAKRMSKESWQAWIDQPDFTWTKVTGGMVSFSRFQEDQEQVHKSWYELAHWGRRDFFETQGSAWAFHGSIPVPPRNTSECCDFVEKARDVFLDEAGTADQRPSGINFLWVLCDVSSLVDADDDAQEIEVPVLGFLQTKPSKGGKWERWLPYFHWRPMRNGLCGNKEFEDAEAAVRSDVSGWTELLREGALGRNNARRMADAKMKASFALFEANSSSLSMRSRNSHSLLQANAAAAKTTSSSSSSTSSRRRAARNVKPRQEDNADHDADHGANDLNS
jgi:hypothetical protein